MSLRIRLAAPDAAVTPEFIEAGLETATQGNMALLQQGLAPSATALLARGARWRPEPYHDGEHFDLLDTIAGRGWGDCDDWASGLAAEYRVTGADPGARAIVRRSGDRRWHALTQLSDGSIVDPSQWGGMPQARVLPLTRSRFGVGEAGAIISPNGHKGWFARCDMPVMRGHVVGVGWGCCSPQRALAQAVGAACHGHVRGDEISGRVAPWVIGFDLGDVGAIAGGIAGGALGGPAGAMAGAYAGRAVGSGLEGGSGGDSIQSVTANLIDVQIKANDPTLPESERAAMKSEAAALQAKLAALQAATPPAPTREPTQGAALPGGGSMQWGPCAPIIIRFQ